MGDDDMRMNLQETELRLGLPGTDRDMENEGEASSCVRNNYKMKRSSDKAAELVGWPPIRSFRKNTLRTKKGGDESSSGGLYVKVSMDGAPYLRKIDLRVYTAYKDLLGALESMFKIKIGEYSERDGYYGSEYEPTYEDKDGDWMLVGDVPWEMFRSSCSRLRIMRHSEVS